MKTVSMIVTAWLVMLSSILDTRLVCLSFCFFFFQAEDGIRDLTVTGVQTCALPISARLAADGRRGAPLRVQPPQIERHPGTPEGDRPQQRLGADADRDPRAVDHGRQRRGL